MRQSATRQQATFLIKGRSHSQTDGLACFSIAGGWRLVPMGNVRDLYVSEKSGPP